MPKVILGIPIHNILTIDVVTFSMFIVNPHMYKATICIYI